MWLIAMILYDAMLQLRWSTTLGDPGAQIVSRDPPLFLRVKAVSKHSTVSRVSSIDLHGMSDDKR